jgi:hypothetical protein
MHVPARMHSSLMGCCEACLILRLMNSTLLRLTHEMKVRSFAKNVLGSISSVDPLMLPKPKHAAMADVLCLETTQQNLHPLPKFDLNFRRLRLVQLSDLKEVLRLSHRFVLPLCVRGSLGTSSLDFGGILSG